MKRHTTIIAFVFLIYSLITVTPHASTQADNQWQYYESTGYEIAFSYPASWIVQEHTIPEEGIREISLSSETSGEIFITAEANPDRLSPAQWFEAQRGHYHPELIAEIATAQVQANSTLIIGQPDTCQTTAMLKAFIGYEGLMFSVTYYGIGQELADETFRQLLKSFSFNEENNAFGTTSVPILNVPPPPTNLDCSPLRPTVGETQTFKCPTSELYIPTTGSLSVPWGCLHQASGYPCPSYWSGAPDSYLRQPHRGLDIFGGEGPGVTPVYATYAGTVDKVNRNQIRLVFDQPYPVDPQSGKVVKSVWMAHMAQYDPYEDYREIYNGERVQGGELIGYQGNHGGNRALNTHLHISYVENTGGTESWPTLDPGPFLKLNETAYYPGWTGQEISPALCTEQPADTGNVSGYDEIITRGVAAKIIILMLDEDQEYNDGQCAFNDVCPDHPYYRYIRRLKDLGITSGDGAGNYNPNNPTTRGQLTKFIIRARGENPYYGNCNPPFPDVPCENTFYHDIRRLKEIFTQKGISLGYSDGTFRPDANAIRGEIGKLVVVGLDRDDEMFWDVLPDNLFYHYIIEMKEREITTGCNSSAPQYYCPDEWLLRGQAAKFIIRSLGEEPYYNDGQWAFDDVGPGHTFYHYIRRLRELGISDGYSNNTYRPDQNITRAEMAKLIVRSLGVRGITCQDTQPPAFPDVPPGHAFYNDIQCLKELGITDGYSDGNFKPDLNITRAQAAKFVVLALSQRTPQQSQESSNTSNNNCTSSAPVYAAWRRYIVPGWDTDCVRLPVLAAGHMFTPSGAQTSHSNQYEITAAYTGLNADIKIEVLASNGSTVLASVEGLGQNGGTSLLWTPSNSGTYYIRMTNLNPFATTEGTDAYLSAELRLPPDSELVGYWPFEENSGNIVYDMTDNNNDGTIYNAVRVEGKQDQALHFDGVDDYVQIPDSNSLDLTDQITIAAWVKPDSVCNYNNPLVQKDDSYGLKLTDSNQAIGYVWFGSEPHGSTTLLSSGKWYYLVATFNRGLHQIYVNGVLENESLDGTTLIPQSANPVYFASGAWGCYFNGTLDEVRIYKATFTPEQIQNLYWAGLGKVYLPVILRNQ